MHITKIELENFKNLSKFEHEFSGGVYLITGENEVGKTTVLSAIATLLTGGRTDNLLKQGEEKGRASIEVGEGDEKYIVEVRFSDKNPRGTITIEKSGSGLKSSNLTTLQNIFKYQDFDAHEFVRWSETADGRRKQVEAVKSLLPKEAQEELLRLEREVLATKESRKTVNADIRSLATLIDESKLTPEDLVKYAKPVKVGELATKKSQAQTHNEDIAKAKQTLEDIKGHIEKTPGAKAAAIEVVQKEVDKKQAEVDRLLKEISLLNEDKVTIEKAYDDDLKVLKKREKDGEKWIKDKANQTIDVEAIQAQIDKADEHNEKAAKVAAYKENQGKIEAKKKEQEKYQKAIDDALAAREKLIDESKLPVKGLDFGEDGLTLNGIPFRAGEVSTSQEMEVAAKLIIAKNPTVKVFKIAQGESLGAARLKAIVEFANKAGYQGFIEEVRRGQDELMVEEYQVK